MHIVLWISWGRRRWKRGGGVERGEGGLVSEKEGGSRQGPTGGGWSGLFIVYDHCIVYTGVGEVSERS